MKENEIKELLEKVQKRDSEKAFRKLYDLCYDRFFRTANFYLHNDEWAQEVTLDVFLSIWNNRKKAVQPDNFFNYYFIILKNASLNYLEKEQRRETIQLDSIPEKETSSSPENILLDEELFKVYLDALDELPERCREVFLLIREEKMSYAQVAEQLNISPKTVDAQLQKASWRIKEKINEYFSESDREI